MDLAAYHNAFKLESYTNQNVTYDYICAIYSASFLPIVLHKLMCFAF